MAALPKLIAHAKRRAPGFARILEAVDPRKINSRKALASLPVTRKSDLGTLQKELPPLGGLNATPVEKLAKIFISPGPIYDPEGRGKDWWRTARGLFAGGFRAGDRVLNSFAYHFTPAGSMLETRRATRSAAPCSRPAPARPRCRSRRCATLASTPTSARRRSSS